MSRLVGGERERERATHSLFIRHYYDDYFYRRVTQCSPRPRNVGAETETRDVSECACEALPVCVCVCLVKH